MSLSPDEESAINSIIGKLQEIFAICDAFVSKSPLQLSDNIGLTNSIKNNAQMTRNQLKTAIEQFRELEKKPHPNPQQLFDLKAFISQLILTNYNVQILPNFEKFTENILNNERAIKDIVKERRATPETSQNVPSEQQIDADLSHAKNEIASAKQDSVKGHMFDSVTDFAAKAKPYVEKIIKGAKIALTIIGLFV